MNYTISMTDILLAVSVGCNLWFLFLLLYERIMDTRIVRFFKGIVGLWRSLSILICFLSILEPSDFIVFISYISALSDGAV